MGSFCGSASSLTTLPFQASAIPVDDSPTILLADIALAIVSPVPDSPVMPALLHLKADQAAPNAAYDAPTTVLPSELTPLARLESV